MTHMNKEGGGSSLSHFQRATAEYSSGACIVTPILRNDFLWLMRRA